MKKILHKIKILFMVFLVVLSIGREERVKADAGVLSVGAPLTMTLSGLSATVLPIAIIGLMACLLIGYTVSNWDEVCAFGNHVANELAKMGHSVSDFVTGTSVRINDTFKQAVKNASQSLKNDVKPYTYNNTAFTGQIQTQIGLKKNATHMNLAYVDSSNVNGLRGIVLGNPEIGFYDVGLGHAKYGDKSRYLYTKTMTVTVMFDPIPQNRNWRLKVDGVPRFSDKNNYETILNDIGQVIGFKGFYDLSNYQARRTRVSIDGLSTDVNITSVTIPELNISKTATSIPTSNLKNGAISSNDVDEYVATAFPQDETVTLDTNADVTGVTVATLPGISDKEYSPPTVDKLNNIRARARPRARAEEDAQADSVAGTAEATAGATSGTGTGWLDGLWEWLRKLLNAILGLPSAIAKLFADLWKWLEKIWQAILDIPKAIGIAMTEVFEWLFGVDEVWLRGRISSIKNAWNAKLPNFSLPQKSLSDKATFDDVTINIVGTSVVVVSGSVVMQYAPLIKNFLSATFFVLLYLALVRRVSKFFGG